MMLVGTLRWHLTSSQYLTNDVFISSGNFLQTNTIKGNNELNFYTGEGIKSASIWNDGTFWVKKLAVESSKMVDNLNAEFIKGLHADLLMTRDGKREFNAPVGRSWSCITKSFCNFTVTFKNIII